MRKFITTSLIRLSAAVLLLVLPFILLVRSAVFFHEHYHLYAWINVGVGALITSVLLFIYFAWIFNRFTGRWASSKWAKRLSAGALVLVLVFVVQGLTYVSAKNIKHPELRKEFRQLHPILRLGVATLLLLDRDAVLTDAQRVPEDYKNLGLETAANSLHYRQKDGYVYAVDLRTRGRSAPRNFLLPYYFKVMGFRTLRHTGTADHLHVSLRYG